MKAELKEQNKTEKVKLYAVKLRNPINKDRPYQIWTQKPISNSQLLEIKELTKESLVKVLKLRKEIGKLQYQLREIAKEELEETAEEEEEEEEEETEIQGTVDDRERDVEDIDYPEETVCPDCAGELIGKQAGDDSLTTCKDCGKVFEGYEDNSKYHTSEIKGKGVIKDFRVVICPECKSVLKHCESFEGLATYGDVEMWSDERLRKALDSYEIAPFTSDGCACLKVQKKSEEVK